MTDDPIVAAVRAVRDDLSRRFNYNVHAIFEDMRSREKTQGLRTIAPPRDETNLRPAPPAPPISTPAR